MTHYCYLNGKTIDTAKAHLHVQDRGFRFGDGVFETIAVYHGIPYQWENHMQRLKNGLHALDIPFDISALRDPSLRLISKNQLSNATLRISISRGVGSQGYLPTGPAMSTVLIEAQERHLPPIDEASLWLSEWEKPSPKALPVQFKLAQGINSTLARMEAAKHGCQDSLLCNAHGEVCEASSANIFWRKDNTLYTPALECGVLDGTTRHAIMRISPYPVQEGRFLLEDMQQADAVVLTNANWQAMPITAIKPNGWQWEHSISLAKELRAALAADIEAYVQRTRF